MASIRYRAPWRVMVKGDDKPKGVFVSKTQAEALSATLIEQGIDKDSINLVQERKGTWEVRVRRQGGKVLLKSFPTKTAASAWAEEREGEIVKGAFVDTTLADRTTVGELFGRFAAERTNPGKSGDAERCRLKVFQRLDLALLKVSALQSMHIAAFRDAELKRGLRPASVVKNLELMSRVLNTAHREWGIRTPVNPASAREVRRPKLGADAERNRTLAPVHIQSSAEDVGARVARVSGKDRLERYRERLAESHRQGEYFDFHPDVAPLLRRPVSEYCAIMRAGRYPHWFRPLSVLRNHAPLIIPGVRARERDSECRIWAIDSFGIETAMRRGEMAQLEWDHVHLDEGYLRLPPHITKGQYERIVPLTLRAERILRTQHSLRFPTHRSLHSIGSSWPARPSPRSMG